MNLKNIIVAITSLMFFLIGADKFLGFLEPPCTLEDSIPSVLWTVLGIVQLLAGVFIWLPKFQKHVAGFFMVFMLVFIIVHLTQGTSDVGGAAVMAVLLGLITWNPDFLKPSK